jgi:Kdo2-lipid IVA lauroyltransferase/acyltransferase
MKHRPRHMAEYVMLRVVAGVATVLPHRAALAVGWVVAALGYVLMGPTRVRTKRRIRQALGDLPARQVNHIAWTSWRNLMFNGIEMMRASRVTLEWIKKVTDYTAIEQLLEQIKGGGGCVLAVPHMGNWELAALAAQLFGAQLMTIVRRQKNLLTDAYLSRLRAQTGVESIYRDAKLFTSLARGLQQGKVLAILPDLHAKADFIPTPFLRHTANIPAGMAMFARRANVPVLPAYVTRMGWARHQWHYGELIRPDLSLDEQADRERITKHVISFFDTAIREHPEQYFWFNKRWVLGEEK